MKYNTDKVSLPLPEYGRNIQNMINYICTLEDKEKRNRLSHLVVSIMKNIHPVMKDMNKLYRKLWHHFHIMADYKINVSCPFSIPPKKESSEEKPKKLSYNNKPIRYKHYGQLVERLITKSVDFKGTEKEKKRLLELIIVHMKKSVSLWNKNAVVEDKIMEDIRKLSGNRLSF